MKPGLRPIQCQSRHYVLQQPSPRPSFLAASSLRPPSSRPQPTRRRVAPPTPPTRPFASAVRAREPQPEIENPGDAPNTPLSVNQSLKQVETHIGAIYDSPRVEPEGAILQALNTLISIAKQSIAIRSGHLRTAKLNLRQSSAGAILSLDTKEHPKPSKPSKFPSRKPNDLPAPTYLSQLASDLLNHEKVFISPGILSKFVDLQSLLGRPQTIPEIFDLYAHKPVPQLGSSPPKYSFPSPRGHKQAIPADIAEKALSAAIAAKDLALALNVLNTTYCTAAWRRYRILTKLVPPAIVAAVTPLALYMIAQEISVYSNYIEPWKFKTYSFLGLMTYVGCTGTLGYVAFTTANDHHDRVVWVPGMPLTERWLREHERAALDRIACAWGFKELWKRGDEDGEEWEALREWILRKGMILDKPDLLPGMNP